MTTRSTRRAAMAGIATVIAFPSPSPATSPSDPAADFLDAAARLSPADLRRLKGAIHNAKAADIACDPIFEKIEAHRKAMAACHAAVNVSASLHDGTPKHRAAQAITDHATEELEDAGSDLADVEPTTSAGVLALLAHVLECIREGGNDGAGETFDGGNWRLPHTIALDDGTEEHFIYRLLCSLESTLQSLGGGGA